MNRLGNLMTSMLILVVFITAPVSARAVIDTTPPTTSATLAGTPGSDGWYTTAVTVTLAATDGADGSGVASTEYSLDNMTWLTYSAPIVLDKDGDQFIYFRSNDWAGNVELPAKSQEIKINKSGLVGSWHMDGNWNDATVSGNNGTGYNGVAFSANAKVGTYSGSFNGVNNYVSMGSPSSLVATNAIAISAWIYPTGPGSSSTQGGIIVNKEGEYELARFPDGSVRFAINNTSPGWAWINSNYYAPQNTWTHLVLTYSASGGRIYVYANGVLVYQGVGSGNMGDCDTARNDFRIGGRQNSSHYFQGLIDEVSIYNRALSTPDIESLYRNYAVNAPTVNPVTSPTATRVITIRGTKQANTAIVVNGSILVPLDGTTSWQANYTLSAGTNFLTITAQDGQKITSLPVTMRVVLDTTPPQVAATTPANLAILTTAPGAVTFALADTISSLDFAATLNGAAVTTTSGSSISGTWRSVGSGINGTIIFTPSVALSDGRYTATIKPTDSLANGSTYPLTFTIDSTPPVLAISTLSDGAYTNNETLNIAGTVVDSIGVSGITVNDIAVQVSADGSFSYALLLKNGTNTITVTATDSAGNTSTNTRTVNFDQTAPVLTVTAPADNSKTGTMLLKVSGTVDKTSTVTVKWKDVVQSAIMDGEAFTATINLEPGYNTIEITATDLAGNHSSQKRTVLYDDQKPSLAILEPNQDMRTRQNGLIIKGTVQDRFTEVGVTISVNNEVFTTPVVDGAFEQMVNFVAEKTYDIFVTATNEVGSSTSVIRNVIYDITPPVLSIDPVSSPTNRPNLTVSGTREAGISVIVSCATASVGRVSYPNETTWQAEITGLREGENVVTAASADEAGNAVTARTSVVLVSRLPEIRLMATPFAIWPPNHQMVPVTIAGGVDTFGANITSVAISVRDEYGKFEYNNLTFGSTVMLEAWRNGNDKDGRKYTIAVVVTDNAGNTTAKTATVTVPHDESQLNLNVFQPVAIQPKHTILR